MIDENSPRGRALLSVFELNGWTLKTFMASTNHTFSIMTMLANNETHTYKFTREELVELHAHFLVTNDPRQAWFSI